MKIGIDLGGTKTEGILLNSKGVELKRIRIKTEKNYKLKNCIKFLHQSLWDAHNKIWKSANYTSNIKKIDETKIFKYFIFYILYEY